MLHKSASLTFSLEIEVRNSEVLDLNKPSII